MTKKPLPSAIEEFVKRQTTIPVTELWDAAAEAQSPYGSHWYRAVAAMLLSGRVAAKHNGFPNMTDVNRICKEANLNQYFFERIAKFLVSAKVIRDDGGVFVQDVNYDLFWKHRREDLTEMCRSAIPQLIQEYTDEVVGQPTLVSDSALIEFLTLFFTCFHGQALRENQFGHVMREFGRLPNKDLKSLANNVGLKIRDVAFYYWKRWLDEKERRALLAALYTAEWVYYGEKNRTRWVMPSPIGLGLLGLRSMPEVPPLAKDLKATSSLAIFVGAGVDFDKLVPLFRCCKIRRVDQLIEFQVDPKRLKELPSSGEELRAVLAGLDPLPSSLVAALQTKSCLGGKIGVRYCSALVKPATPAAVTAIRHHSQLKGYLEPGAPAGYLLVKPSSNPDNFIRRCEAMGFEIESL